MGRKKPKEKSKKKSCGFRGFVLLMPFMMGRAAYFYVMKDVENVWSQYFARVAKPLRKNSNKQQ